MTSPSGASTRRYLGLLALLAYLPAMASRPGRMPTDTKLYLYLNPGRLLSDAINTWDTRQFGGWVPHQVIAYLWPQGPWYWVFDKLGVPDWVAHRLWIGTLLFLAAAGVFWASRLLGLHRGGALVAAAAYQLSPYVLPYISRTSAMLLPWAAVGWLVGLTIRCATADRRWRYAALMALVVLSCSAVNATAVMMIAPAPLLWLVHAVWQREVTLRRAVGTACRVGALSLGVSLWWITMLRVQGRYGADVLSYSESLQATSYTSTSLETLRGMGYWLAYIRDPFAFTTTAARAYMESGTAIVTSFAVTVLSLVGLALVKWRHRRYAALMVFTGVVLAVGVHPIWNSSPLLRPLAERSRSGLALALRSSTRALPVSSFGLALGLGALCTALATVRLRWRALATPLAVVLAVVNLPALFGGGLVDPALTRDQDPPAAWRSAAAALDATSTESRVWQLPGSEFGAFRWGYTVDPPLPGLTTKPLITRDLLPLGSAGMMDLMYALDDRVQQNVLDPAALQAVASYLGVDTVWLANDLAYERFRTPLPVDAASVLTSGASSVTSFGAPSLNQPAVAALDEHTLANGARTALPPVQLLHLDGTQPIVHTASTSVVVAGSGDGVVDAAAAGVLNGNEAVIYSADQYAQPDGVLAHITPSLVVLTDSNRSRAHHWRSSQDVTGFTEAGGSTGGVLRADEGDQRLPIFGATPAVADQTTAALDTGLQVRASSYGEPFAYRPEQRPAMAVDGDLSTAWVVGDRGDPIGEYLTVSKASGSLRLRQADRSNAAFTANRMITRVHLISGDGRSSTVTLDAASLSGTGQVVAVPGNGSLTIRIDAVAQRPGGTDTGPSGVGFAELGLGTNHEVVSTPRLPASAATSPLSIVLTRLRVDAENRWRSDPEPVLDRVFTTAGTTTYTGSLQLQLDRRATDAMLSLYDQLQHQGGAVSSARLTGSLTSRGLYATDGDRNTAWTSPFGSAIGVTLTMSTTAPVDHLDLWQPTDSSHSIITALTVAADGSPSATVAVPAPDSSGHSTVSLPHSLAGATLVLTVAKERVRTTVDRRYGERTVLPVAINEVQADGIVPTLPGAVDLAPGCTTGPVSIDGQPLSFAFDTLSMATLGGGGVVRVALCNRVTLNAGTHHLISDPGVLQVDQVVLSNAASDSAANTNVVQSVRRGRSSRSVTVGPCPQGCWLVMAEGLNAGWSASVGGTNLGVPVQISGGSNGWWLPASTSNRVVQLEWAPQRSLYIALALSAVSVLLCLALALRRRAPITAYATSAPLLTSWSGKRVSIRRSVVAGVALVALTALVGSPHTAMWSVIPAVLIVLTRRPRSAAAAGALLMAVLGALVLLQQHRNRFVANAGWPLHFERWHTLGMLVIVLVLVGALLADDDHTL